MSAPHLPPLAVLVAVDWAATLEVIGVVALFAASIGLGVAFFVWARNWRQRIAEDSTPEEPIETYQHMLDSGLIDSQEFARIQARLHRPAEPLSPSPSPQRGEGNNPPLPPDPPSNDAP